jgi:D-tyrosyl-tRNA(Tyr) deacylase
MSNLPSDAFFICVNPERDPCALHVFAALERLSNVVATGEDFDGYPVLVHRRADGTVAQIVRTRDVVSNDYGRYAAAMTAAFGHVRAAIVVNWHEGANAPDRVLTFHSTGDVPAGIFAPTDPNLFAGYTLALERERLREGLEDYRTIVEATHWSGVVYGARPADVLNFNKQIYDLEIGSSPECWRDERACTVLARVCLEGPEPSADAPSFIYCGGVHFEENVTQALLSRRWGVGHVLPNHWLVSGDYGADAEGEKLAACIGSYTKPPGTLVIHKGLDSEIRNRLIEVSAGVNLRYITHKGLRA